MCTFSVIIPTYNRAVELNRALESVVLQTCDDWEIIVIDDGGKDNSYDIVRHYQGKFSGIFYFKFPNMGASVARNIGVGLSKGKYIAFLDSDDVWSSGRLQSIYEVILAEGEKLYVTDFKSSERKNSSMKKKFLNSVFFDQLLLSHNFLGGTINIVAPRKILIEIDGFDQNLTSCQDHDLYNRLLRVCELRYVPGEFAIYYLNSGGRISGKNKGKLLGHLNYYKKHKNKMNALARLLSMKKIALVSYYNRSSHFFIYSFAWLIVKALRNIFKVEDERELYFVNCKFINWLK